MKTHPQEKNKGFALLIAVIIISLVVSVSLSLTVIVIKEIGITSSIRESMKAFYAAESGFGCAKYWLTKNTSIFFDTDGGNIQCAGETYSVGGQNSYTLNIISDDGAVTTILNFEHDPVDNRNVALTVAGVNVADQDAINIVQREREAEITFRSNELKDSDIMLVIDTSGSVCRGDGATRSGGANDYYDCEYLYQSHGITKPGIPLPPGAQSELDLLHAGTKDFLSSFTKEGNSNFINNLRFGVVPFTGDTYNELPLTVTAQSVIDHIENLNIGGRTNTIVGLVGAVQSFDLEDDRQDIIILVTDGLPTHAVTNNLYPDGYTYQDVGNNYNKAQKSVSEVASLIRSDNIKINVAGIGVSGSADVFLATLVGEEGLYVPVENFDELAEELLSLGSQLLFRLVEIR